MGDYGGSVLVGLGGLACLALPQVIAGAILWGVNAPLSSSGAAVAGLALVVSGMTFLVCCLGVNCWAKPGAYNAKTTISVVLSVSCTLGVFGAGIATFCAAFGRSAAATTGIVLMVVSVVLTAGVLSWACWDECTLIHKIIDSVCPDPLADQDAVAPRRDDDINNDINNVINGERAPRR
jgi:hypothetical protein